MSIQKGYKTKIQHSIREKFLYKNGKITNEEIELFLDTTTPWIFIRTHKFFCWILRNSSPCSNLKVTRIKWNPHYVRYSHCKPVWHRNFHTKENNTKLKSRLHEHHSESSAMITKDLIFGRIDTGREEIKDKIYFRIFDMRHLGYFLPIRNKISSKRNISSTYSWWNADRSDKEGISTSVLGIWKFKGCSRLTR